MNPEILINLRTILTQLIPDELDIRRVMADATLDEARVKFSSTAVNHWHAVLTVARNANQMAALLVVVEREYPTNDELLAACAAYRQAVGQITVTSPQLVNQFRTAHYPRSNTLLPHPLINHDQAVDLFQQMLQSRPPHQVLRLVGEGNMGKTTLLDKIFPALAQRHTVRHAVVDLRNPAQSPLDLLDAACQQLDPLFFSNFVTAYEAWLTERAQTPQNGRAWFDLAQAADQLDQESSTRQIFAQLTRKFVEDLRPLADQALVLLFDAVDLASPTTQAWLMDDLLSRLRPLTHVRVVVAGRRLPPAASSYAAACHDHELRPVLDEAAYIRYCQAIGTTLLEGQIRQLAQRSGYSPGAFASIAQHFIPGERTHG